MRRWLPQVLQNRCSTDCYRRFWLPTASTSTIWSLTLETKMLFIWKFKCGPVRSVIFLLLTVSVALLSLLSLSHSSPSSLCWLLLMKAGGFKRSETGMCVCSQAITQIKESVNLSLSMCRSRFGCLSSTAIIFISDSSPPTFWACYEEVCALCCVAPPGRSVAACAYGWCLCVDVTLSPCGSCCKSERSQLLPASQCDSASRLFVSLSVFPFYNVILLCFHSTPCLSFSFYSPAFCPLIPQQFTFAWIAPLICPSILILTLPCPLFSLLLFFHFLTRHLAFCMSISGLYLSLPMPASPPPGSHYLSPFPPLSLFPSSPSLLWLLLFPNLSHPRVHMAMQGPEQTCTHKQMHP